MTNDSAQPFAVQPRRPSWLARLPELELDCRGVGTDGLTVFRNVMKETQSLLPGRILTIRIPFEPTFLCRVLSGKGFDHWSEPAENGDWKIYFLRKHADLEHRRRRA